MKIKFLVFLVLVSISASYCKKGNGNRTKVISSSQENKAQREKKKKVYTDDTLIVNAVNNGSLQEVKKLLESGTSANSKNKYGVPILILAAYNGNGDIVELLLKRGSDINARDRDGDTALHNALYNGRIYVVYILANNGARFDIRNKKGKTPVNLAMDASTQNVDNDADIYKFFKKAITFEKPLVVAVKQNNIQKVKQLLESGADINSKILTYVIGTSGKNEIEVPVLNIAIKRNYEKIVELLLKHGAKTDFYYSVGMAPPLTPNNAMVYAVINNNVKIIKMLLKHGISKKIAEAGLIYAAKKNNTNLAKILINYGVDPDCASYNYTEIRGLYELSGRSEKGFALKVAIRENNVEMVEFLLKNRADITDGYVHECGGKTLLVQTIEAKSYNLVKLMLKNKPISDFENLQEWYGGEHSTPLNVAIKVAPEIATLLINSGVSLITVKNSQLIIRPALYTAAENNRPGIVRLLIQKGVDINEKFKREDKTALSIAKEKGFTKIIKILSAAGAR